MLKKMGLTAAALLTALIVITAGCGDDDVKTEEIYLLYHDIYGVVEYESDGVYPPPPDYDTEDEDYDGEIMVTLFFGEDIDFYEEDDVYGYFVSYDDNTNLSNQENFNFPFVPSGYYWLKAEFTIMDSCFQTTTGEFFHSDTAHTFQELRPTYVGSDMGCWNVGLAAAPDEEMVQVSERCWVTRSVYENIYKPRMENTELIRP